MPRSIPLSPEDQDWLRANYATLTQREMADHLGCCVDTLKRKLMVLGIAEFSGSKYVAAVPRYSQTWTRPCMDCGSTKPRPRNHYYCPTCRTRRGFKNDDE